MRKYLAVGAVVCAGLFAAPAALAQGTVAFASLPQGTINYFQSSALAKVIQEHSNLRMRVVPLRSGEMALAAVNAGEAEFFLGAAPEAAKAIAGADYFHGHKNPHLRLAFNLRPLTLGMLVRKDSGINTYADLKGKRLPSGWNAFPSSRGYLEALLATAHLTMKDVVGVPVPGLVRSVEDFKEGKNDGTVVAVEAPMVREADSAVGGLKYLSIAEGPGALAAIQSVDPNFFIETVKPGPRDVGILAPTRVLAFDIVITTSDRVPASVVETVVKTVHDHRADLIKAHASFAAFHPDSMAKRSGALRYHPGAIAYYKEIGLWHEAK
jgi:uncharacterized protein